MGATSALVLAGGKGTRLWWLTYTMPKRLVPVANRLILHHVMDLMADCGIREVGVIVAPETGEQVRSALEANPWGFAWTFITQEAPLGLAHALKVARGVLAKNPF